MKWLYFVLGMIAWQIIKMSALIINREIVEYRQRRFIKLIKVTFPEHKTVTFISVDSSDKRAMKKMEQELREMHGIELGEDEEHPPLTIRKIRDPLWKNKSNR